MIHVSLFYNSTNELRGYQMKGHADAAPYGEDLVCAAASTLAIVIENSLCVQGVTYEAEMDEGYVRVLLTGRGDEQTALIAQAVLKTMEVGINALVSTYPDYIEANSVLV